MAEIPLYVSHTSVPARCPRRRRPHRHSGTRLAIGPVPSPWLIRFLQKAHNSNPPDFIPRARPDAISRQRLALFLLAFPGARGGSRTHTPRSGQGILTTRNTFPVDRNQPETWQSVPEIRMLIVHENSTVSVEVPSAHATCRRMRLDHDCMLSLRSKAVSRSSALGTSQSALLLVPVCRGVAWHFLRAHPRQPPD